MVFLKKKHRNKPDLGYVLGTINKFRKIDSEVSSFAVNLYNKTRHYINIYTYMLPIAGQTAGPNRLKFCVDTQGWSGGILG